MDQKKDESNPFLPDVEVSDQSMSSNIITSTLRSANHPLACFFHVFFKLAAMAVYLFCTWFTSNFVLSFIVIILLSACDFWTVKNITGRLLVGLRWWNVIDENGNSSWKYESTSNPELVGISDSRVFWTFLIFTPIIWILFMFMSILKFNLDWLIVSTVACILTSTNLVLYMRAARESKTKVSAFSVIPKDLAKRAAKTMGTAVLNAATQINVNSEPTV